jgi:peptidoglycan/xylan/chitin deacetylase (PgdA/CDA1 family)
MPAEPPVSRLFDLGGPRAGAFALTFDDGPEDPWTEATLDCLESLGVAATFFVIGCKIAGHEDTLRRMVDLGCGIEIHGWEHVAMTEQQPEQVVADIERTKQLIHQVTGWLPRFVRPPHGAVNAVVLEQIRGCGMTPAFWSTHGWDWTTPGVEAIVHDVSTGLRRSAVVLLHDGGGDRSQTIAAIPAIVRTATERSLRPVRLETAPASS